jgi:hypothetical protein
VVDSVAGCEIMALPDCFSGYHQIWLCKEDKEETSFITAFSTYCYLRLPEDLKNAGLTLCRMMKDILKEKIKRNVSGKNTPLPGDTDYGSQTRKRLDPSSGKWLGSHTPRIT